MNALRNFRFSTIALIILVWLVACGALLVTLWPWHPATSLQWMTFILLGPLAYGAVEYSGGLILSPKLGARISSKPFSWLRIAYALCAFLLFLGVLFAAVSLIGRVIAGGDA